MTVTYLEGDLLQKQKEYNIDIVCHQVNCQGKMESGIAKQIRDTYPFVYERYVDKFNKEKNKKDLLGQSQLIGWIRENKKVAFICNFFAQYNYGYDKKRYTSYDAFWNCLMQLKEEIATTPIESIGFPYNIGCCRGGANWNIIETMIKEVFKDYDIYIVKFNKENF